MVVVDPSTLVRAATDVDSIGASVEETTLAAALPTGTVLPLGADEVSAAITALFNGHAHEYHEIAAGAHRFHQKFAGLLAQAGQAYQQTEQAAEQLLRNIVTELEQPFTPFLLPPETPTPPLVPTNSSVGLIVGGTDNPFASKNWAVGELYLNKGTINSLLYTPEQFWPGTPQLGGLTLGQSVHQGVGLLGQAIQTQFAAGNHVTIWTTSQSSVLATDEIRTLMAQGSPYTDKLSFILTANPNNPNGGFFERFTGLYIPLLDVYVNGATPPNSPYVTSVYTNQYDAVADFPNYPLNVVSDLNAVLGSLGGQHNSIVPRTYYELPTSPGYTGNTTYYMSLDNGLPLVQPLRILGIPGNAVADLLQPDLRVIVDMGYASGQYADIPTPAQLFGIPNPQAILPALATGTMQGVQAFGVDVGLLPQTYFPNAYPYLPSLDPGLNIPTGQPSVTAISLLTGAEGQLMDSLGLIPSWDQCEWLR
jgi:hypothetical protein